AAGANGNGANVSLSAGTGGPGTLTVIGDISADGVGSGNGGIVSLSDNSTLALAIDGGSTDLITARGGPNGGSGGSVTINNSNTGGVSMNQPTNILVT